MSLRRAFALWLFAAAAVLVLAAPTAISMVQIWERSGNFNHAFAVPPLVAWLVWRRRGELARVQAQPDIRWWPALLALSGLVWLSEAALANAPGHFALVGLLVVMVPALMGTPVARTLMFPLGYAFFMVPFGEFLMPRMMEATATFTVLALQATGVPVYREGLNFVISSGNWSVVEACSGIRYLMASVCVGVLFAHLNYQSNRRRLAFVVAAVLVPIVANWLRAYLIVMLGHLTNNRLAAGVDHLVYGWVFFGFVMMLMFLVGARYTDLPVEPLKSGPADGALDQPAAADLAAPTMPTRGVQAGVAGVMGAVLALAPLMAGSVMHGNASRLEVASWPSAPAGWQGPRPLDPAAQVWRPRFVGPDEEALVLYAAEGAERDVGAATATAGAAVGLHQAVYRQQTREHKLLSSENVLLPVDHPHWRMVPYSGEPLRLGPQGLALSPQLMVQKFTPQGLEAPQRLAVQLVMVDGRWMSPGPQARIALAVARMSGRPDQAVSWVFYTEAPTAQVAHERLQGFVNSALGTVVTARSPDEPWWRAFR